MSGLIYVLAKIGFTSIPDTTLKAKADILLEQLRRSYPLTNIAVNTFNKIDFNGTEAKTSIIEQHILTMQDVDRTFGFRLQPDALFIHTLAYKGYEDFWGKASVIIKSVVKTFEFTHVNFLGTRYINKYQYIENIGFNEISRGEFLQPMLDHVHPAGSNLQSVYLADIGRLQINSGITVDGYEYSPDIYDLIRDFNTENKILPGVWAHLDFDSFIPYEKVEEFNLSNIEEKLSELHKNIKMSYTVITKQS